ncbi:YraN family protein [Xanthomonas campestris]|uniref:YraN family protein n=1 Tax=Xanthomonas campestris TaxID=339 RepID=UPI001E331925|nr:YraN family protein [Xanthomonas campestris]MCC4603089.1 YraN family protein [Xanthomonas campestris pv. parthenii]
MPAARQQRGAAVEAAACALLEQAGLRLVVGNATYRGGELDLVMRDGQMLVFVEVRYRRDARFGGGAASVDLRKRRKLVLAAQLFLGSHPALAALPCRFDVVDASGEPPQLHWIRDAFRADDC